MNKDEIGNSNQNIKHILEKNSHCVLDKIFRIFLRFKNKNESIWFKSKEFVTKCNLKETERKIMSKISEFATKQSTFNDRMDVAVNGLQGDVQSLTDTIAALQATSGSITTEDQTLLDQIGARASAIADKLDALDALTPSLVPVTGSV